MGQTLLRLKQLKIGIKQPKNSVSLDLSKHLSRHGTTQPILTRSIEH